MLVYTMIGGLVAVAIFTFGLHQIIKIGLVQAEKWDGKLPVTMVPQGALPFLSVK